jgi:hypothetical protein
MFETKDREAIMTSDDGNPVKVNVKVPLYDLQHKLIGSMMTNNKRQKADDGRIYDTGIFKFSSDMDQNVDEMHVELKPLTIIKGKTGQFISIGVQVDYKAVVADRKTPSKARKATVDATIGTGKLNCIPVCVCTCVCIILSLLLFPHSQVSKSIDPDGMKVGDDAFDDDEYARFARLYDGYDSIPPAKEKLKHFSGVERNLFYLVSFLLENDQILLEGDFVDQVTKQFDRQPVEMMTYAKGIVSNKNVANNNIESPLQIEPPPAIIEAGNDDMDTSRDQAKRRR